MSFRYYPRYVLGNPQRRTFLPNFWLKLVPNEVPKPANFVQFKCPLEMTDSDVRNYLEQIYKVPVMSIRTVAKNGEYKNAPGKMYLVKDDDHRMAYVQLPKDVAFEYPDLFPKEKDIEEDKNYVQNQKQMKEAEHKQAIENAKSKDIPTWFSF